MKELQDAHCYRMHSLFSVENKQVDYTTGANNGGFRSNEAVPFQSMITCNGGGCTPRTGLAATCYQALQGPSSITFQIYIFEYLQALRRMKELGLKSIDSIITTTYSSLIFNFFIIFHIALSKSAKGLTTINEGFEESIIKSVL